FDSSSTWPWSPWVASSTDGVGTANTGCVHDGTKGFSGPPLPAPWYYRTDVSIGAPGEKLSIWVKPTLARFYLGFSVTSGGGWSLVAAANTSEFRIEQNTAWGFSVLATVAQSYTLGSWYKLELTFGTGGT